MRDKVRRWVRFIFGGIVNTGVSYGIYLLVSRFLGYQEAYFSAYLIGIVFSYWFNSRFVFFVALSWRGLFSFPLVYLVQYAASALLLRFFVVNYGVDKVVAPLVVTFLMLPLTFVLSRLILAWSAKNTGRP